jgi:tRNA (mo5U34)-methyltransferase
MDLRGVSTDGVSDTSKGLPRLHLPESFSGKSVLDIGAWDGFYSFEAARRHASRVLATDSFVWESKTWGSNEGFLLARGVLGLEDVVEDRLIDVMDLSPATLGGTFDVTFFLGVLYHLKNPLEALERVASVTKEFLVLETERSLNWVPEPAARVYVGAELNDASNNYFAFNQRALESKLRSLGFTTRCVYRTPLYRRVVRAALVKRLNRGRFAATHTTGTFRQTFRSARIVIHARRS